MVDNTTLNSGTGGDTIATDDIGGVKYQRVKLVLGADNTNDGDVASGNPLPVSDAAGSLTVDNTNIDNLNSSDFDTGAGTDTTPSIGIAVPASGGAAVITGDVTNGLDVDVTRVQGTVTVDGSAVTQPVSAASLPLPTGAATSANQLPDGHNVTVDNAAGASAVNIQDGGNSITVDGTVTANAGTGPFPVSDNGGSLTVDNAALSVVGGGTEASAMRVTLASDSTGVISVDDNGSSLTVDNGGTFAVQSTLQTGSSLVGDVGLSGARTSGGTTLYKNIDVDETEDQVKGTAGQIYWIHAMNLGAATRFLKIYNATAVSVVVGSTTPDLTFPLATQGDTNGAGFTLSIPNGIAFSTAITIAATTGVADADSGAPGANEVIVNLGYA